MMAAGKIAAIGVALVCGAAASTTPALAEVIDFRLGTLPAVQLSSYALSTNASSFTVTAPVDPSTALWSQLLTSGRVVSEAVLTDTTDQTIFTWDFSDVLAESVLVNSGSDTPTVTAKFDYRTVSEHISTVPEPSTWAMMLLGFGGLATGGYVASRRRRPQFA
jgi:hypothetical protein